MQLNGKYLICFKKTHIFKRGDFKTFFVHRRKIDENGAPHTLLFVNYILPYGPNIMYFSLVHSLLAGICQFASTGSILKKHCVLTLVFLYEVKLMLFGILCFCWEPASHILSYFMRLRELFIHIEEKMFHVRFFFFLIQDLQRT